MSKKLKAVLLILAILIFGIMAVACDESGDKPTKESGSEGEKNFQLTETAVFKDLKITADEIVINPGSEYFGPEEGKKFVAVKFTIENISEEPQTISSILLFDAYADEAKCDYSFTATSGLEGSLDGELSPGKKMTGYYGAEVSKTAQKLELEVKGSWLSSSSANFTFTIPAE